MSVFESIKGMLMAAFTARPPEVAFLVPKLVELPLAWPAHITSHVSVDTKQTMETQICAEKWIKVLDIMNDAVKSAPKNPMAEEFVQHLNGIRACIQISHKELFDVKTESLIEVYRNRFLFDEICKEIRTREIDLSNVVSLYGNKPSPAKENADIVSGFKDKYIEMMEKSVLPFLIPGWNKSQQQPEQLTLKTDLI